MRLKFLLLSMLLISLLNAQEPNRSLIISEIRIGGINETYVEFTNMGETSINLSEYKIGRITPWSGQIYDVWNDPFIPEPNQYFYLPEKTLQKGESYVITAGFDFGPKQYRKKVIGYEGAERQKQTELYDVADFVVNVSETEADNPDDSVTVLRGPGAGALNLIPRECLYIEHHSAEGDSVVVDQVNGAFDCDGRNCFPGQNSGLSVAGVENASGEAMLIRRFDVKTGNLDFANARGVGLSDSEWIPIVRPEGYDKWRDLWWTVGNHGSFVLDENTLDSDVIDVDFANKTLTVPWGMRRLDDIMRHMKKKPGVAWNYHLNPNREDSLYLSAQTGDQITIYVCGEGLTTATFEIVVTEPTADDNIVVPKAHVNISSVAEGGLIRTNTQQGIDGLAWPRVTRHDHGNDTITGTWHGLPNALRTDSLLKYLEKPDMATWEFVWVDDIPRPDLKNGDKLKIVSANGIPKEYYLQLQDYYPSFNANLSAIQWPEIPDLNKGIFGWIGDTIPNFSPTAYNYRVEVPLGVERIPHLVVKTQDVNAKVDVKRAINLTGTEEDRTVSFTVTAENDTTVSIYNVELKKEKEFDKLQHWQAEPFLSEFVWKEQYGNNFAEIYNPGTLPLDLSDYMITMTFADPANAIKMYSGEGDWNRRYAKYIPGYKYASEAEWLINPGILEQDLSVNPIIEAGGVFVGAVIQQDKQYYNNVLTKSYWDNLKKKINVQFNQWQSPYEFHNNPWNEKKQDRDPIGWGNSWNIYLYKILNDSIKRGLKPANDPNDFELIETFGMDSQWIVAGIKSTQTMNWKRKPDIYKPNPLTGNSFGTNPEDSEWIVESNKTWQERGVNWPWDIINVSSDIGQHFMNDPTHYKSTVSSVVYKVSEGYSIKEEIRGVVTGTSRADFEANIIKANEDQTLTIKRGDNELGMDDMLSMDDVLVVVSADSTNTTQYVLEVGNGLSSNAYLSSTLYKVNIDVEPKSATNEIIGSGYITGFEYGTKLQTILNNVKVPAGASLSIVDSEGAYIPLKMVNYDTMYVQVTINPDIYFNVVAEDGVTTINYRLQPATSESDAFILSDLYTVVQSLKLVKYVPHGTNVQSFLSNIISSLGATVKVVDKMGLIRTEGSIKEDDKVVVTSLNELTTNVYHLSMLPTQYIPESTYLAYILSKVYFIDQVDYVIYNASGTADISEFYSRTEAAVGATFVVVDSEGNEKTTGNLEGTDKVKVTSADGKIEVIYTFGQLVGADNLQVKSQIEIFPNPTTGKLNICGVKAGTRIQVFNSTGAIIYDVNVRSSIETLSLNEQPPGMYLIVISNDSKLLGRFKAVRN